MRDRRVGIFVAVAVACIGVAVAVVASAAGTGGETATGPPGAIPRTGAEILFRSRDRSNPHLDDVMASVPLDRPGGPRTSLQTRCERGYYTRTEDLCVASRGDFLLHFVARILDARGHVRHEIPLDGFPSRARISRDGRLGAVTTFSNGHSYAVAGAFSTATLLIDMRTGRTISNLERFRVIRDGRSFWRRDFNFWGVTFAEDANTFYATLGTNVRTYLVRGDVRARTAVVLRQNVECPSLSPDGTRIAYKYLVRRPGVWRLHVLDLATGRDTALAETRTVDDQAEWLDDRHVLYAYDQDVWVVPADGSGSPRELIAHADSPAVLAPGR